MINISDKTLLEWNALGFIPGPKESENDLLMRVNESLNLKESLEDKLWPKVPFVKNHPKQNLSNLSPAFERARECYDISPSWILVFFSNYKLPLWHGGCAWIIQLTKNAPPLAFLQLKKTFYSSKRYLGMSLRDELIAHELAHVGRAAFDEPKFEEFLAYRSSKSRFRKIFGPIVQSAWESLLFVMILFIIFLSDLYLIAMSHEKAFATAMWLKAIPLSMIILSLGRLFWRHRSLHQCFKRLRPLLPNDQMTEAVLYRLTDREIIEFSRQEPTDIRTSIKTLKMQSLRWHVLLKAYFESNISRKP